jgi:hypothetical protein
MRLGDRLPRDSAELIRLWKLDSARYRRHADFARKVFAEDHPLVQMWVRRQGIVDKAIELLSAEPAERRAALIEEVRSDDGSAGR